MTLYQCLSLKYRQADKGKAFSSQKKVLIKMKTMKTPQQCKNFFIVPKLREEFNLKKEKALSMSFIGFMLKRYNLIWKI